MLRGLKTLAVRMREHCRNAHVVAGFLERHPKVEQVLYPGLPTHPGHAIAAQQMRDFGGMVSFLAESEEEAVAICERTKIFKLAESLGGVESLIEHPARMTHASTADAPFAAPRNLVRLSVGLESAGGPDRRPRGRARPFHRRRRRLTRAARSRAGRRRRRFSDARTRQSSRPCGPMARRTACPPGTTGRTAACC